MDKLIKKIHAARTIGITNAILSLRCAAYKEKLDAKYLQPKSARKVKKPSQLVSCEQRPSGAHFRFEHTTLEISYLSQSLVFIGWDAAEMTPSYAVAKSVWPTIKLAVTESDSSWHLQSEALRLKVSEQGALSILKPDGQLLRWEKPPQLKDDGWSQQAALPPEACIYGLGERAGRLNLRPGKYKFWNTEVGGRYAPGDDPLYICMPVYLCVHEFGSYLVFYDNTFAGQLTLGEGAEIHFEDGPARYYIAAGSPAETLESITELTGRAPLPPRWALGYHQSKWGYRTEAEMRRVFKEFQRHDLPLSVLTLDGDHLRGYRTLTVDEARYPNLLEFSEELRQADVHLVASTNPGVKIEKGFDLYEAGLKEDVFCKTPAGELMRGVVWPGWTAFTDFTNPRVRDWWGQQYHRHLKKGVAGFWHDMNEPSVFIAWGEQTFPLCTRHDHEGRGGDHQEAHNVYGMLMNKAGYEGLRTLQPGKRPFILSRSGWVGSQRYAWSWTGDVETSWAALRQTVACVLGLSLSGMPYSGPDIGGFTGSPTPELFVRWFQLASFLPFFRTHCAFYLPNREPWEFGQEVLRILREQLKLRYRLLPYWYTLSWQANQSGHPLVRPIFWDDPTNQRLWEIDDAFIVGEAMLVAPILAEGSDHRSLYLPKGSWHEFDGDRTYYGETEINLDAPLERIPVLVRGGSILPAEEDNTLILHIYRSHADEEGTGLLFSDAGDGYGETRLDRFELTQDNQNGYQLTWISQGKYPFPYEKAIVKLHGFEGKCLTQVHVNVPELESLIEITSD